MHVVDIIGMQASKRIQTMSLMIKPFLFTKRRVDSEIWGSPGSRQLLQLQQFHKILKISGPPFYLVFLSLFGFA